LGKTYLYRLRAFDAAGNSSGYATAQTSSSGFQANVVPDQDSSVVSDDQIVTLTFPAGALTQPAFCSVGISTDIIAPKDTGYFAVDGPYQIDCRDSAGNVITAFNKSLVLSAQTSAPQFKGLSKVVYFGQKDDGSWQILSILSHDKKSSTDKVDLQNHYVFTIMGQQKKSSWGWIIKLIFIIILIAIILFISRFLNQKRIKRVMEREYDEYLRKAKGL